MASKEGMVGLHPDSVRSGHNVSGSSSGIALNALIVIRGKQRQRTMGS